MKDKKKSFSQPCHVVLYEFLPPTDGGIAQVALETALELHRQGARTALCGFGDLLASPIYNNVKFDLWPLPHRGWKNWKDFYLLHTFIKMFFKYGTKVVLHSQTWKTARVAVTLASVFGWKVLVYAHGNEVVRQFGSRKEKKMKKTFSLADLVFANSAYTAQRLLEKGITNVKVNKLAVNPSRFPVIDTLQCKMRFGWENRKVILTAARVVERKGQDTVIRALPEVVRNVENVLYVIAGSGSDQEIRRLKEIVEENQLQNHVYFAGYVDESLKSDLYNACDVYVMVSRSLNNNKDVEGFGITFLEANCCCKPVIGSRSGGIPDAIDEGVNGFLVEPEDQKALSGCLIRLLQDEPMANDMGSSGRRRVMESFTWEKYTGRMLEMIKEST